MRSAAMEPILESCQMTGARPGRPLQLARGRFRLGGYALNQLFPRQFEELDDLIPRDGRVVLKEFINGGPTFDVIEKLLDRDAVLLKQGVPLTRSGSIQITSPSLTFCPAVMSPSYAKVSDRANRPVYTFSVNLPMNNPRHCGRETATSGGSCLRGADCTWSSNSRAIPSVCIGNRCL